MKSLIYCLKNVGILFCLICGINPVFSQTLIAVPNAANHVVSYIPSSENESDVPFIFQNQLVVRLTESPNNRFQKLALFDGQNYNIVNNPDNGEGYLGYPITFRNELYVRYKTSNGTTQLAKLVGNQLRIIPNIADNSYEGLPFVYKNRLYFMNISQGGLNLAYYDGNTINLSYSQVNRRTIIYKDKLYFVSGNKVIQDDASTQSVFLETTGLAPAATDFAIHQDTLFMMVHRANKILKTNGTTIQEVAIPNNINGEYPYYVNISLNDKLYIFYGYPLMGQCKMIEYHRGGTRLINNPDNGAGIDIYASKPIVYRDTLFFHYIDAQRNYHLAKLNGSSISFLDTSRYVYNYGTYPIIFNNNLYYVVSPRIPQQLFRLSQYNGRQVSLIQTHDSLSPAPSMPIIFGNRLYVKTFNSLAFLENEDVSVATQNIVDNKMLIYPNPTSQELNIEISEGEIGEINIYNLLGENILNKKLNNQINTISVESLNAGVYLANIMIGKKVFNKTFIKQ